MTTLKWILRILLWAVIFFGIGCLFVRRENRNKLYAFIAAWALEVIALFTLTEHIPSGEYAILREHHGAGTSVFVRYDRA